MNPTLQPSLKVSKVSKQRSLHRFESLAIALVGGIPLTIGIHLRRFLYRYFLNHLGKSVIIRTEVELLNAHRITLNEGVILDRGVRIHCTRPNSQVVLRKHTVLGQGIELYCLGDAYFEIGESTSIGSYSRISGLGPVKIGRNCLIAPHVGIFPSNHNYLDLDRPINAQGFNFKGIEIGDDCWLGSGVKVLDGVTIGEGCVVGAGAVVNKSLPPYSLAVGVPAKVIGNRRSATSRAIATSGAAPDTVNSKQ